ncbi:hypothetical protein CENSYa_1606 [Cenarchaeum symbiosum A]|uniref:Secreted periplasmic Zn-dependent protease n=1 Tax=Cenarchaeum symbiosum (strain A) TaxID=414004 RepID=A0RY09_CENSY|nr:hypothetical protein CENSYa_1606 [Cenarchaeum symbiosum A]
MQVGAAAATLALIALFTIPAYSQSQGAPGLQPADNEEPELDAYLNGTAVYGPIQAASDAVSLLVRASDLDGDLVSIGVIHDDLPPAVVSVSDHGNGTATVLIDISAVDGGTHVFWITASDGIDTVREPYAVAVP